MIKMIAKLIIINFYSSVIFLSIMFGYNLSHMSGKFDFNFFIVILQGVVIVAWLLYAIISDFSWRIYVRDRY